MKPIKHVISVSGGKDSTATLLLALNRCPEGSVVPIFCDTGNEHKQTYEYLNYLELALDIKILRLTADFTEQIAEKRIFIANDQRTGREYDTVPVFEADGITPVPKRNNRGQIVMRKVRRDGIVVEEPAQKTRKVGGGRKVRWSNKAKRRALAVLHPTGNPFIDLCLWKGRFPSRKAQFCTEELKRNIAVSFQIDLIDQGFNVISWQGVRRDESPNRRKAKKMERSGPRLWNFRPIVTWSALDVFDYCAKKKVQPNPLYTQGMTRVGCMPCINVNKSELREISIRFPEEIERIKEVEILVGQASKRGFSTFRADSHDAKDRRQIFSDLNILSQVDWSKTTRGGKQYDLLYQPEPTACASAYGLCE